MSEQLQWLIAIVILVGLASQIWRGGRANPVGTGALQRQLTAVGAEVKAIDAKLEGACSKSDLDRLRGEVERIEEAGASSVEIAELDGRIAVLDQKIEGWGGATRRVEAMVQRIEGILVKKALGGE